MRSGKSTACEYLKETYIDVRHINMKDGLVSEMKARLPNVLSELLWIYQNDSWFPEGGISSVDDLFRVKPPAFRALMQNYGTEVRRGDNPDYWVNIWKQNVDKAVNIDRDHVVCDDVRFLNEAKAVKDMGGVIVRIVRPDITDTGSHQSEVEMDQIEADYTVTAKKDNLRVLFNQLDDIFNSL